MSVINPKFNGRYVDRKYSPGAKQQKKRVFHGNRYTRPECEMAETPEERPRSASEKKLVNDDEYPEGGHTGYRIVHISTVFNELSDLVRCKCGAKIQFRENGIRGWGSKFFIDCENCGNFGISSSPQVGSSHNVFEVNRRAVMAMRLIGQGRRGLEIFSAIMDLPPPVTHNVHLKYVQHLKSAAQTAAAQSMRKAISEEKEAIRSDELTVSGDGTWRKPGHSSLQGVATLIGYHSGKVVDIGIKNSYCNTCAFWEQRSGTTEYLEWLNEHEEECSANHYGSAGKMEVDIIAEMFQRSEDLYGVKYKNYIGDGDSKTYKAVAESKPYGDDCVVVKKECVGHVQKRMGTRLRNLTKAWSGKKLSDGRSIGGRGRLTAKLIDELTVYYGKAIRDNPDSAADMAKSVWATLYHKASTDSNPQHQHCPQGEDTWCKWRKAEITKKKYQHPHPLPKAIVEVLEPVYEALTSLPLLDRCVGGFTQNSNESFNGKLWSIVPKKKFSGLEVLETGAYLAVTCFNDGGMGLLKVMESLECTPRHFAIKGVKSIDDLRIVRSQKKIEASTLESRKRKRQARLQEEEETAAAEGALYGPGIAD